MFSLLSRTFTKLELADGDYVSADDNWAYSQSFAQLCYDPVPSLVTLDPCARKNANAGSHGIGVFNPNGSSYANADVPGTIKGS